MNHGQTSNGFESGRNESDVTEIICVNLRNLWITSVSLARPTSRSKTPDREKDGSCQQLHSRHSLATLFTLRTSASSAVIKIVAGQSDRGAGGTRAVKPSETRMHRRGRRETQRKKKSYPQISQIFADCRTNLRGPRRIETIALQIRADKYERDQLAHPRMSASSAVFLFSV